MHTYEGHLVGTGLRIGIVRSRWNEFITMALLHGTLDGLRRHGVAEDTITIVVVPGAFEIPVACLRMAATTQYDAIIALGAVIRGATSHYEHVTSAVTSGVAQVSMQTGIPCLFGVITVETIEQAIERAGTKAGNRGFDAAIAAIEMANLMRSLTTPPHEAAS